MQDVKLYQGPVERVFRELLADAHLGRCQRFAFQEYKDAKGLLILSCDAYYSVTFQIAKMQVGQGTAPISIVLYIEFLRLL